MAGISISALTNQGLFTQAQNAKNLTEEKTAEENEILTNYLEQMNAIIGGQVTEIDGAVVTPINDITTWLKTGEISKQYSYTTIEQVIADSTCTEILMNNENAMKYLARSTEFADEICTSETAMTYLGQSEYVDDTVLNSDLWVSKIKSSSHWDKVYTKQFTIHAGVLETITIEGYAGSFTTNSDGTVTHALPLGELTLTGSVSDKSFIRTVTADTTDVYVMPEGALYWYGNECEWITGGFETHYDFNPYGCYTNYSTSKNTNSLYMQMQCTSYYPSRAGFKTINELDLSNYSKINLIHTSTTSGSEHVYLVLIHNVTQNRGIKEYAYSGGSLTNQQISFDITDIDTDYKIGCFSLCVGYNNSYTKETQYAIWAE